MTTIDPHIDSSSRSGSPRQPDVDLEGQLAAINRSLGVIEFEMDGTIIRANDTFLKLMGYTLDEIRGEHHSIFVEPSYRESPEYEAFWAKLRRGEFVSTEFKRLAKGGREIWIQGSYNPVLDANGRPHKVVKIATDVTDQKLKYAEFEAQVEAIRKSQGVIEFDMDGTILSANLNFLAAMGYTLDEVRGKHHSMFVDEAYRQSAEYKEFWETLKSGRYVAAEFKRLGKGGREVWIQASYNPILGLNGRPIKVVKFATDVTDEKRRSADFRGQIDAIRKSQGVIEFDMDGKILNANDRFLEAMGYSLDEVRGKHHGMFVDDEYRQSAEYKQFWEILGRGEYVAREFKRLGKDGREVWIQASYNPILDPDGRPYKVVKFATDITDRVRLQQTTEEQHCRMKELSRQVIESANQFAEGSRVVAESSSNLSDGAQTQAASVEEMTASIEELIRAIQVISSGAAEAKRQADETAASARSSGQTVSEALNAMRLIEKSSEQINDIIQVISEISSQTNLLALNAAIEAARAGEHGLGFAVVADEVRKLAERSSEAAKEITQLIKESSRRVSEGAQLSEKVGESLTGIVEAVTSTAGGITEIADQTESQSASAEQVQSAIKAVSETTESGAVSAEELAASAEQLGAQAQTLQDLVARFEA
ncbi:MAG: methyl-accepting chemotaxis protein [Planctomycetota bacterium]|jgi:methyl-accepting chemotaxis protein